MIAMRRELFDAICWPDRSVFMIRLPLEACSFEEPRLIVLYALLPVTTLSSDLSRVAYIPSRCESPRL